MADRNQHFRSLVACKIGVAEERFESQFKEDALEVLRLFAAWPKVTPLGWAAVVFIGVSSGVGYFLWLWALGHASPTRVTVFLALSPITAGILGVLLLGETLSFGLWAGLAAVVVGIRLTYFRRVR